jgi:hypothetical protein
MSEDDRKLLRQCAAHMIVEGNWDNHSDQAIKKAFTRPSWALPGGSWPESLREPALRFRDSGELREEIRAQLQALPAVE